MYTKTVTKVVLCTLNLNKTSVPDTKKLYGYLIGFYIGFAGNFDFTLAKEKKNVLNRRRPLHPSVDNFRCTPIYFKDKLSQQYYFLSDTQLKFGCEDSDCNKCSYDFDNFDRHDNTCKAVQVS
jgi:hypothetical protein